jgi:hypothetical protein
MIPESQNTIKLSHSRSANYLLYRVLGDIQYPLSFDLINMDGVKQRSIQLVIGNEFVIPISTLDAGEYLYVVSAQTGHLRTGVVRV